jgi:hypothetical protein
VADRDPGSARLLRLVVVVLAMRPDTLALLVLHGFEALPFFLGDLAVVGCPAFRSIYALLLVL